uniref:Uncharacterized protein n=1 Tax=Acrobeloides nanus TaxID=290746 RepID=A0A914DCT2_9BILA
MLMLFNKHLMFLEPMPTVMFLCMEQINGYAMMDFNWSPTTFTASNQYFTITLMNSTTVTISLQLRHNKTTLIA